MNSTVEHVLSVRELSADDIPLLTDYWLNSSPGFLSGMGVDLSKMPSRSDWHSMLGEQLRQSYAEKGSYGLVWLLNGEPVGHSNVNKIIFGQEAFMHLHLWKQDIRQKGLGLQFVRLGIPLFFKNMELKTLYCEPYALNPAPNRILEKAGFQFLRTYTTIPGWLNFEQPVNLWSLSREQFESMK